jgi:hypothetical protein
MEAELARYPQNYPSITRADIDDILESAAPYITLHREEAVQALEGYYRINKKYPRLEAQQASFLSRAVFHGYIANTQATHDRNSRLKFQNLPGCAQTVIFDIHYHGYKSVPDGTTRALRSGAWEEAARILEGTKLFGDRNRRRAALLRECIGSGALPRKGDPCVKSPES